ncbi:hypothetical protein HAX54_023772 [Datura stramonium]|uniref:Uncharacterized protein n=1 Tax=Datura stramonium TaxID=4076 RepID=A0ABS8UX48_DATST|nr:hypothetical protein [Datura stramonium]
MWTVNHPLTQYQSLSLNLNGESWAKEDVREPIYRRCFRSIFASEIRLSGFMYPSGVDRFKRQFAHILKSIMVKVELNTHFRGSMLPCLASVASNLESPPGSPGSENSDANVQNGPNKANYSARSLLKSASISASKCVVLKKKYRGRAN